ncbi:hypothetical protein [Bacillus sp. AF23]|uniref:hypothetical protein n=1 Tax=Bacillus sp. AF23 TaxID=2821151 RepID=UPI001E4A89CA|nr:hypothetical protein [Bacillus sp. AF23]MCC8350741.1 hypothetical protein [Bacillus sp. AF23]
MILENIKKSVVYLSVLDDYTDDTGTALFVKDKDKDKRYLLTVKHLIFNRDTGHIYKTILKGRLYGESTDITIGTDVIENLGSNSSGNRPIVYEESIF